MACCSARRVTTSMGVATRYITMPLDLERLNLKHTELTEARFWPKINVFFAFMSR